MSRVVVHAELALDECRNAIARPQLTAEPVRRSSFVEPSQDLGPLLR
jgi:hypothetical protein